MLIEWSKKDNALGKMTWERRRMKLRMVPPPRGITPSSTSNVWQAVIDSGIGLRCFTRIECQGK
jgi:hypothetical protein